MEAQPAQPITVYTLPGAPEDAGELIRPAQARREWMDRTPDRYAYRCVPLSAANTMGWEILSPVTCEFLWNGLTPPDQLFIYQLKKERFGPRSHFGSGVVTWELPFLFQTPPNFGMVVCGPANHDHAHITPMDGFVRTDWLPFPFTVNWRITAKGESIRFERGEPIARVFPFPLTVLEQTPLELRDLADNPTLQRQFNEWSTQRRACYQQRQKQTATGSSELCRESGWRKNYVRGVGSESAEQKHQSVFRCQPVNDLRDELEPPTRRSAGSD